MKKRPEIIPVLLLVLFLVLGVLICKDYGASPDEYSQIEAGHITWRFLCETFGGSAPQFTDLPALPEYYNRYYGQAASFPTVLVEALRGFRMDSSTILRMRHLWNFLNFFLGVLCFAWLVRRLYKDWRITGIAILMMILLPRIFADSFYNDRDVMLISWLLISLAAFQRLIDKPGWLSGVLCGLAAAIAVNTRYFGLLMLIPLLLYAMYSPRESKRWAAAAFVFLLLGWYLSSPVVWSDPLGTFRAALLNFTSGKQRVSETQNQAQVLFLGRLYPENDLPWFYLPLWMIVSTPLLTQLFALIGIMPFPRTILKRKTGEERNLIDISMFLVLVFTLAAVMLIRPVEYDGWRHFYFLYVPVIWFAVRGAVFLLRNPRPFFRKGGCALLLIHFSLTAVWMIQAHPYQMVYFNPLFRRQAGENFDRDYWRLSTTECLNVLEQLQSEGEISIGEYNGSIDNALISLLPQDRARFNIQTYFSYHREPIEYLVFNYSNFRGNDKLIPLYRPVYDIERDGMKLSTIFQRDHSDELYAENIVAEVRADEYKELAGFVADGKFQTEWSSGNLQNGEDYLELHLARPYRLRGLTLLPGANEREYARSLQISTSDDGEHWMPVSSINSGLLDYTFDPLVTRWLRLQNRSLADVNWSIKEILFYGKMEG